MGIPYTGNPANVSLGSAVQTTIVADGDPDNAASINVGAQKVDDYLEATLDLIQLIIASTWAKQTSGTARNLFGVAGGLNLLPNFIVVGDAAAAPATILTSMDGLTWTARTAVGTSAVAFAVAGNTTGTLAVVLMNGASGQNIQTSPDGTTWTLRTSNITLGSQLGGVVHNGSLWCVVGGVGGASAVATSPDGLTWTARTLGAATDQMVSVTWAASLGLFIACGYNTSTSAAEVFTSPDGITWTSRTLPTPGTNKSACVAWSPTASLALVAAQTATGAWSSPDGINWTLRGGVACGGLTGGGPAMVQAGRQWLSVYGAGGVLLASSLDPTKTVLPWLVRAEWTASGNAMNGIAVGPQGKLIAVGNAGVILTGLTTQIA